MDGATPYFCAVAHARAAALSSKLGVHREYPS
jgi:hypothetical protein